MLLTLTVTLLSGAYATGTWRGMIEIHSSSLLEALHLAIQDALGFDNDHLYEFFVARTERSRDRTSFTAENGSLYDTSVESLFPLPDRQHLYYLFDYGDYWLFRVSRTSKTHQDADPRLTYPRLAKEIGEKPEQYPAQDEQDA